MSTSEQAVEAGICGRRFSLLAAAAVLGLLIGVRRGRTVRKPSPSADEPALQTSESGESTAPACGGVGGTADHEGRSDWRQHYGMAFWASVVSGLIYTLAAAWVIFTVGVVITIAARGGAGAEVQVADSLIIALACVHLGAVGASLAFYIARLLGITRPVPGFDLAACLFLLCAAWVSFGAVWPENLTPGWLPLVYWSSPIVGALWVFVVTVLLGAGRRQQLAALTGVTLSAVSLLFAGIFVGVVLQRALPG